MENKAKQRLREGGAVLGTWLSEFRSPAIIVALARSGIDFVLIDAEHSQYNLETIEDLCIVAREVGLCVVVRTPEINRSLIGRILDAGALGLMVPRVQTRAQVEAAVVAARFPPRGQRGFNLGMANTRFRPVEVSFEAMRQVDDEILIVIQIEERAALENVDDVLGVEGVDVGFVGPGDLSISLGIPGQIEHPQMKQAVASVVASCRKHGIAAGFAAEQAAIEANLAAGVRFLTFGGDVILIQEACRSAMEDFRRWAAAGR
jgi:2-keto-3-deoxy-L-rhamnonate aldolase RhmA